MGYLALAAFDSNEKVAFESSDSLLDTMNNTSIIQLIWLGGCSVVKLFPFLRNKQSRQRAILAICAALTGFIGLVSLLPVFPFMPFTDVNRVPNIVRSFYWIWFALLASLGRPILHLLVSSREDANFYPLYFRSGMALGFGDNRGVVLIKDYLRMNGSKYQYILLNTILYGAKPHQVLVDELQSTFRTTESRNDKLIIAQHLAKLAPEQSLLFFENIIKQECTTETKEIAINAFLLVNGYIDNRQTDLLLRLLSSEISKIKSMAVFIMGELKVKDSVYQLHELTSEKEENRIRFEACRALGKIGMSESVPTLRSLLTDNDERIRDVAYASLWDICRQNTIELPVTPNVQYEAAKPRSTQCPP